MENQEIMNNGLASTVADQEQEVKTYTEDEVMKLLQAETDRRVTSALKKQATKFEKQLSESEKLRNMDETQRETYKLQQRINELEEQNRLFAVAENKATLAKALSERNIPVNFVDYLVAEDADEMMNNVTTFEKLWKAAISDAVTNRITSTGTTPKGSINSQMGITKEQFNKMTLAQQTELYQTNKQLYLELSKN